MTAWFCIAPCALIGADEYRPLLADTWIDNDYERVGFKKVLILGITDQDETRRHFEDKFVSHVRARGLGSVRSISLARDLTSPEASETVVQGIEANDIDCAITVRAVGLTEGNEDAVGRRERQRPEARQHR